MDVFAQGALQRVQCVIAQPMTIARILLGRWVRTGHAHAADKFGKINLVFYSFEASLEK